MKPYSRIVPRGSLVTVAVWLVLAWAPYALSPSSGALAPLVQTVAVIALVLLGVARPDLKVALVRRLQRHLVNPVVRLLFALGLNPLGLVVLETRGRVSGRARRTPVGNGRCGASLWIVAEHGLRANYVRNILADPRVRVRLRRGLRYRWVEGFATVLTDDDPLARQRTSVGRHPLRALNALNVRLLGAELVTVHVALDVAGRTQTTTGRPPKEPARCGWSGDYR